MTPDQKREYQRKYMANRRALLKQNPFHDFGNPGRPKNTPEELWNKVDKRGPDECWPWIGWRNETGYGRTEINDKSYYAHRVIFDLVNPGVISLSAPKDTTEHGFILHSCDNPPCCNPAHLRLGTHADNMADKIRRGRTPDYSLDKGPRCLLTMEQAREARRLHFEEGYTRRELRKIYPISKPSMDSLITGKTYKEG